MTGFDGLFLYRPFPSWAFAACLGHFPAECFFRVVTGFFRALMFVGWLKPPLPEAIDRASPGRVSENIARIDRDGAETRKTSPTAAAYRGVGPAGGTAPG